MRKWTRKKKGEKSWINQTHNLSCCWMLMEMIWKWKRGEEDGENLTFLN